MQLENLFDDNAKKYKRRFKKKSKSCESYVCGKKVLANSDDENFWRTAIIHFDSIENEKKNWQRSQNIFINKFSLSINEKKISCV